MSIFSYFRQEFFSIHATILRMCFVCFFRKLYTTQNRPRGNLDTDKALLNQTNRGQHWREGHNRGGEV